MSISTWAIFTISWRSLKRENAFVNRASSLIVSNDIKTVSKLLGESLTDKILKRTITFSLNSILKSDSNSEINAAAEIAMNMSYAGIHLYKKNITNGISIIGTMASTAPYIGLLGTVWGIVDSMAMFATAKSLTLQAIAPQITEALVATGVGLLVAIPASILYNILVKRSNAIVDEVINLNLRAINVASMSAAQH
ncbi:MotA/TolQ/ExbB proton channel family protein [Photobacterium damselae]|uniref:MotA/TolQ/ExbB proton channel family protein n=1 Tax=Photobacterium damselae TaxID=38293 RepID=UPI001F3CB868|nr:MotA/TolQ/ExbB proton channel family protein [Photobacterium damselae]UKA04594.1 MotA/TolQ/ExbB proton channel family protein [Photobacterium damselae subsp. damselae]